MALSEAVIVDQLARLHTTCLPHSAVGRLGAGYARSFYRFARRSPVEIVLVEVHDDEVIAGCTVSLSPATLGKRMVLHTALPFYALIRPFAFPWDTVLADAFGAPKLASASPSHKDVTPELVYIFTRPGERGAGHGRRLIDKIDDQLSQRGFERYIVHTFDDPKDPAVRFYQRCGMTITGRSRPHGMWFLVLERRLNIPGEQSIE